MVIVVIPNGEIDPVTDKAEMQQSMEYTLKIANGILLSARELLDAIIAAVGMFAQISHIVSRDEDREAMEQHAAMALSRRSGRYIR